MEKTQRLQLLKDNGDCPHCVGDHKSADCTKKECVCGGGRDDRGCSRPHKVHELFCIEAKVFSLQVQSISVKDNAEGVVLLIMKV